MEYAFDAIGAKQKCIQWIRDWFEKNGNGCNAVIGISGGKDSTVVAALCVEALGNDRVIGVLMPCGVQNDIEDAVEVVNRLGIKYACVNIEDAVNDVLYNIEFMDAIDYLGRIDIDAADEMNLCNVSISEQTRINLPARIRMATLYAVSQSCNGRVANTCNLSEDYVGYSTRYGDSAGDFAPLACLTTDEVMAIGDLFENIPHYLTHKTPSDGLCGKSDEDNLGFTYSVLNRYIRTGLCDDPVVKNRIDDMHKKNMFKMRLIPVFVP